MAQHAKHKSVPLRIGIAVGVTLITVLLAVWIVIWTLSLGKGDRREQPPGSDGTSSAVPVIVTAQTTTDTTTTTTTTTVTTTAPTAAPTSSPYIRKKLLFSSPEKTVFTTADPHVSFLGSADPSAKLTLNGTPVLLTDIGGFSLDMSLDPGKNTFTFSTGEETVNYTITYQLEVIRSISPAGAITGDGGGSFQVRATVRKGAQTTAQFNGQRLTMTPVPVGEEGENTSADFETLAATFTLPAGKPGVAQTLSGVTVTSVFAGQTQTKKTGSVTVRAKKVDSMVVITRDYAETFSGNTVNDYSRPTNAYLPAGTLDKVIGTGSAAGNTYYHLGCGKWVYTKDAQSTTAMEKVQDNTVGDVAVTVSAKSTGLAFPLDWRAPYGLVLSPQTYAGANKSVPDYSITEQTTEYVDITFSYAKTLPDAPVLDDSPLFSGAEWRTGSGDPVLRLTLREKGHFYGYSVKWDGNTLAFSFKHPNGTAGNTDDKPLAGIRIVLDPGHGGSSSGTYGTIKGLYEKTVALDYSLILRDKLTALGATVDMTRTTDVLPDNPTMATRTAHARNNNTDLFLSIHMNGVDSTSAHGCTLHYFNEYSHDIALLLTDAMRTVEKEYGIGNRAQVLTWSPFFVTRLHDCPSVLIECGFMTNANNMTKLVDPTYRDKMTDAIVQAVVSYFDRLSCQEQ